MKFGKKLQRGIYEPWKEYYIPYGRLKRLLARKRFIIDQKLQKNSSDNLSNASKNEIWNIEINTPHKEKLASEVTPLHPQNATAKYSDTNKMRRGSTLNIDESDIDDFFPILSEELEKINTFFVSKISELRIGLEEVATKRTSAYRGHHTGEQHNDLVTIRDIYIELVHLREYVELNHIGFYKIVKKYDKTIGESTLDTFMLNMDKQPFVTSTEPQQYFDRIGKFVSRDKLLEWERFAKEKKVSTHDQIFPAVRRSGLIFSIIVFITALQFPLLETADESSKKCLALLLFAMSMWITEALPYFATAMLVPPLVVFMGVLKDNSGKILDSAASAEFVLSHIFNHTSMLLLGGYTISSAFSRCQLELRIASWLQYKFGDRPRIFMLAIMMLGLFLSMWINNHTAPILISTIILPIVRDLPPGSRFAKALLLGLAIACNFGGMMTPISSLQNVLAATYLEQLNVGVSFGRWILIATPFCLLCTVLSWITIILIIKPDDIKNIPIVVYDLGEVFGKRNIAVIVLSITTMILFATSSITKDVFGDIGVIAMCFACVIFGSGMLTEVDYNSLSWHTLMLVGGGSVLGKAVQSSGLLQHMADGISKSLLSSEAWIALLAILFFMCAVSTFVSHTVASIILMPLVANIGVALKMPEVVTMGAAFAVSAAMALPFSSFPNVNSLLIVDDFQRPYLNVQDFIKIGLPVSIVTVLLIATLGQALIWLFI